MDNIVNGLNNFSYKDKYRKDIKDAKTKAGKILQQASSIWETIMISSTVDQLDDFTFHIRKSESVKLQSQITDYVLENNESIQNHIVLQPLTITLTGEIGEKIKKEKRKNIITNWRQDKLNPISAFNSEFTTKAQQYINNFNNIVEKIDGVFASIDSITDYLLNLGKTLSPKQLGAFNVLYGMFQSRQLLSLNTDFCSLENMVIQNVEFTQNEDTNMKSEVSITLKQMNFAETIQSKKTSKGYNKSSTVKKKDTGRKTTAKSVIDAYSKL